MKTQVKWNNHTILRTLDCNPTRAVSLLTSHFGRTWPELQLAGISLNPPFIPGEPSPNSIEECTDPDGSVWGVRFFDVLPPGYLISPTWMWVWETASQTVPEFSNVAAVRGYHGFHAAWPTDLKNWISSDVDHHTTQCKALVKGHGDLVLGDVGFRSSKMTVIQAYLSSDTQIEGLRKRYPTVAFQTTTRLLSGSTTVFLNFPADLKKIAEWVREQSLRTLGNEFS